jgi:hypothetical protein
MVVSSKRPGTGADDVCMNLPSPVETWRGAMFQQVSATALAIRHYQMSMKP